MVNFLIIALVAILLIFIFFKWNNIRTKIAFIFILLGVSFLLLTGYLFLSGKEVNLNNLNGIKSAVSLYVGWLGNAGSNIAKISAYAFKQDWKGDLKNINSTSQTQE
ncbi:MAG: hypothetical protein QXD05_00560 [Candidatus Pacearchaeota archaeon]